MNYRVIWELPARNAVQRIYDAASDQEGLVHLITRIGLELSANPLEAGESREPGTRVLFKGTLVVWYRVNERLKEVMVFQVRASR